MNYQKTLDYLFTKLPMFQRVGAAAYKANMDNTIAICSLLKNPENKFKSIHIAGTNGKGSTSHMLASVLQVKGLKVGLYTSPHLKDFRERIKINGKKISKKEVIDFIKKHKTDFEDIKPSFFEMTVGLAFSYFAKEKVDIAVIETGLGGRLDSTNIIEPILSVITNISLDHVALLGNTLEQIAIEKAGIIKSKTPIVIGETQKETKNIFLKTAKNLKAPLYFADEDYTCVHSAFSPKGKLRQIMNIRKKGKVIYADLTCELLGRYQQKNILTVLKSIEILNEQGYLLSEKHIRQGIANVVSLTHLHGRWEILGKSPLVIADTGHNKAGIEEILIQIAQTPHKRLHFVIGMVNDKDISTILKLLPKDALYYFCKANIPRALDESELMHQAHKSGLKGKAYTSVREALKAAKGKAQQEDLVFVGGSTFVVAEVI